MKNIRGAPVGVGAACGEVEIGLHQIAELHADPRHRHVGDLPAEVNTIIFYSTGLTTMAKQPEATQGYVQYLKQPGSVPVVQKNGMDPVRISS